MDKLLKDSLKEQMQIKGLSFERMRQLTGITDRYLNAFFEGQKDKLPAAPYVRGYLMRVASVLELNGQELWEKYKDELLSKTSGPSDRLPENRYALKKISKKWLTLGTAVALIVIYAALNANRFLGKPEIRITSPLEETFITSANTVSLLGETAPANKLSIDGEELTIDEGGHFEKDYPLKPGLNQIEFVVKGFLGKEVRVIKRVIYEPQEFFLESETNE